MVRQRAVAEALEHFARRFNFLAADAVHDTGFIFVFFECLENVSAARATMDLVVQVRTEH